MNISFDEWETEQLQDPEFRKQLEKLEVGFQITQLRVMHGLTQKELARRVGSSGRRIAQIEAGRKEPSLPFLRYILKALDARLELRITPNESSKRLEPLVPAEVNDG